MFVSILFSALLLVVCPAIGITFPNGFNFDETQYLEIERSENYTTEKCEREYDGCSNDCSGYLSCDNYKPMFDKGFHPCDYSMPYCVKNSGPLSLCVPNFPMSNKACLTRALNNVVCTEDGLFPDPTDGTKYHVCNGTSHTILECPANHYFISDPNIIEPYANPGKVEFSCYFKGDMCIDNIFYCAKRPNSYAFRANDYFHYAYCLEIGTMKKTFMFKCPPGTTHYAGITAENTVNCLPPDEPIV